jgi:hypothetical protein
VGIAHPTFLIKFSMKNNQSNIYLEKINIEINPFRYLGQIYSLDIIFGEKIDFYKVINIPGRSRKKMICDYKGGFCFHIYNDVIVGMIEIVLQDDRGKYNPYLGNLPFNLKSGMLRKETQELLGQPKHTSDKKMTTHLADGQELDCYFCHDVYNFSDGSLILHYNYYSKRIEGITISKSN